jgi:hypothetical protein
VALEAYDFGFWRLPGYGDFLDELNPGTSAAMLEMGAPEGFEDAVAWLVPMTDQQGSADASPHWDITFGIESADATAERAEQLGATVVAPPMDAPWVRLTVLRDPQGAVYSGTADLAYRSALTPRSLCRLLLDTSITSIARAGWSRR